MWTKVDAFIKEQDAMDEHVARDARFFAVEWDIMPMTHLPKTRLRCGRGSWHGSMWMAIEHGDHPTGLVIDLRPHDSPRFGQYAVCDGPKEYGVIGNIYAASAGHYSSFYSKTLVYGPDMFFHNQSKAMYEEWCK